MKMRLVGKLIVFSLLSITAVFGLRTAFSVSASVEAFENATASRVFFEQNRGQQHEKVQYMTRGGGTTMFLTATDAVYVLRNAAPGMRNSEELRDMRSEIRNPTASLATAVYMTLAGANENAEFSPSERLEHNTNYFKGNDPDKWRTNIPNYARITVDEIYAGIDAVWYGRDNGVRYDFVVEPGADPAQIAWEVRGATNVTIAEDGSLVIETPTGTLKQNKPFTFQYNIGTQIEVASSFRVSRFDSDTFRVAFDIGTYDTSKTLTIDPSVDFSSLSYSTYLGGNFSEDGRDIAVDGEGNAFVTGHTFSSNFPTTPGSFDTTFNGNLDVFVSKFNGSGSQLIYSTYIGANAVDEGYAIKVDTAGNAFVAGSTASSSFPTTPGAFQTSLAFNRDGFLAKLNPTGSELIYSTFLGGEGNDIVYDLAINADGNAFLCGSTASPDFPTTPGAYDTTHNSFADVFVTKMNSNGTALIYSTYIGTDDNDIAYGLVIDDAGNAYVTGTTGSSEYPTTNGAFDTEFNGVADAFLTKLNAAGSALVYSTFLGGENFDLSNGVAVDTAGNAYVTGRTESGNFPTTAGAFDVTFDGNEDIFITKFDPSGATLIFSTFLGSSSNDIGYDIAVDLSGNAYIAGITTGGDFPTTPGTFDPSHNQQNDVIFTVLNSSGSGLLYSTYLGGNDNEWGYAVARDGSGNAFVIGTTYSGNFPTTPGSLSPAPNGPFQAFVTKIPLSFASANVSVSGQVRTGDGRGVRGATVRITDSQNNSRSMTTSAFGYYQFPDVATGGTYTISVTSRKYTFTPRVIEVFDTLTNVDFISLE